jgi:hypothetical protein
MCVASDRACTRVTLRNHHGKEGSTVRVRQRALRRWHHPRGTLFGKRSKFLPPKRASPARFPSGPPVGGPEVAPFKGLVVCVGSEPPSEGEPTTMVSLAQRAECSPHLGGEEHRLLPGGEVAAPVDLVEVGEAGLDNLDPGARGSPDFAGESREADRNRDRRRSLASRMGSGHGPSGLPVPPGGRGAGARQPIQRDVVQDVVPGEMPTGSPSTNAREILY